MPTSNPGEVVDFDAEAACKAVLAAVEGELRTFVEFDAGQFNPIYVDDVTLAFYEDEEHMYEHFARIHDYVNVDLAEIDLFVGELLPVADRVKYLVTAMDAFKLVRYYVGDQGLFLAVDPDEPVEPVVAAIRGTLED